MAREEKTLTELNLQPTVDVDRANDLIWTVDISDTSMSQYGTSKKVKVEAFIGDTGAKGDTGEKGDKGDTGTAATATVGTTTTLEAGQNATVVNSGSTSAAVFDFGIPKGTDGTNGTNGTNGTDGADGLDITWEGTYNAGTTYSVNDAVSYNGSSYICKLESTGNSPTNTTYWDLMAQKGTDGIGSGDVTGPSSSIDGNVVLFDDGTGKLIKDGGFVPENVANKVTTISAASTDIQYPSAKATKTYADTKIPKTTNITALNETDIADGEIAVFNLTNKDIRTSNKTLPSGDVVGTTDTQTLTNKTISVSNNTFSGMLDWFYPVGTIYETTSTDLDTITKMGNHFGGTWEVYGAGKVLVAKSLDTEFDTIGETGGAKTHTLQTTEIPSHRHAIKFGLTTPGDGTGLVYCTTSGSNVELEEAAGGGGSHNNLQPYIVVYRYRRVS